MNFIAATIAKEAAALAAEETRTRAASDAGLSDRIAQALLTERAAELAAASAPPRAPAPAPPAWLFGPRHRDLDAQRRAAAEAARHELPELAKPAAPAPPTLEAITGYAVPSTPDATPAPRPLCPCCLQPLPDGGL